VSKKPDQCYVIELSARAQKDFQAIQRYTLKRYGEGQVLKYAGMIKAAFANITENPLLYGHTRFDIPPHYKSYRVGAHDIVYRIEIGVIFVVAILHGRMDFSAQIDPEEGYI